MYLYLRPTGPVIVVSPYEIPVVLKQLDLTDITKNIAQNRFGTVMPVYCGHILFERVGVMEFLNIAKTGGFLSQQEEQRSSELKHEAIIQIDGSGHVSAVFNYNADKADQRTNFTFSYGPGKEIPEELRSDGGIRALSAFVLDEQLCNANWDSWDIGQQRLYSSTIVPSTKLQPIPFPALNYFSDFTSNPFSSTELHRINIPGPYIIFKLSNQLYDSFNASSNIFRINCESGTFKFRTADPDSVTSFSCVTAVKALFAQNNFPAKNAYKYFLPDQLIYNVEIWRYLLDVSNELSFPAMIFNQIFKNDIQALKHFMDSSSALFIPLDKISKTSVKTSHALSPMHPIGDISKLKNDSCPAYFFVADEYGKAHLMPFQEAEKVPVAPSLQELLEGDGVYISAGSVNLAAEFAQLCWD